MISQTSNVEMCLFSECAETANGRDQLLSCSSEQDTKVDLFLHDVKS